MAAMISSLVYFSLAMGITTKTKKQDVKNELKSIFVDAYKSLKKGIRQNNDFDDNVELTKSTATEPAPFEQCRDPRAPCRCDLIFSMDKKYTFIQYICNATKNKDNPNIPNGFKCTQLTDVRLIPVLIADSTKSRTKQVRLRVVKTGCELRCVGKSC